MLFNYCSFGQTIGLCTLGNSLYIVSRQISVVERHISCITTIRACWARTWIWFDAHAHITHHPFGAACLPPTPAASLRWQLRHHKTEVATSIAASDAVSGWQHQRQSKRQQEAARR